MSLLRHERHGARPTERLREPREHREVGVKLHLRQSTDAQRGESVAVLQVPERALNSSTATVKDARRARGMPTRLN